MYADFGLTNDVSLDALKDELDAGSFQTVIHAGVRAPLPHARHQMGRVALCADATCRAICGTNL